MKPKTREALNKIGWQTVIADHPSTAINLVHALTSSPTLQEAKRNRDLIEAVSKAVKTLSSSIDALPEAIAQEINHWSATENELDSEIPNLLGDTLNSIERLLPGLEVALETSLFDIVKTGAGSFSPKTNELREKPGRPPDHVAYNIAKAMADVFYLGCGKYPTAGKHGGEQGNSAIKTNGPFQRAFEVVLASEGRRKKTPSTINNMANAAKEYLTPERIEEIIAQNKAMRARWNGRTTFSIPNEDLNLGGMSLFEFTYWQKVISDD